ncbi:hypothetical protein Tco_0349143 [Tanacetum coccineum]
MAGKETSTCLKRKRLIRKDNLRMGQNDLSKKPRRQKRQSEGSLFGIFNKCFSCGDPNNLIGECLKPPRDKNQRVFVGGSWSDSEEEDDEKVKDETCLVTHASSDVCSESSYFSDENLSIDDLALDNEYDKGNQEITNVTFNETSPTSKTSPLVDDDLDEEEAFKVTERKNLENDIVDETLELMK